MVRGLDRETIERNLADAEQRLEVARDEFGAVRNEVLWWRQGLRLAIREDPTESDLERDPALILQELLPDAALTGRPTLRQAMLRVMRAAPDDDWDVAGFELMLQLNNWLPARDPGKRIADMAASMATDGVFERVARGVYRLEPLLAAALRQKLRPITDYRNRDRSQSFPMPDHPAASGGLSAD